MTHPEFVALLEKAMTLSALDQTGLAKRLGVAQSTISRWFQKQVPKLERVAEVEKLVSELSDGLTRSGTEAEHMGEAVIVGLIGAGAQIDAGVEQPPAEGWGRVRTKFPMPADSIAFEVTGTSMQPRYFAGDVIVCPKDGTLLSEIPDGAEAAMRLADGRRFLKFMVRTKVPGRYHLTSPNEALPIFDVAVEWAAHIIMTIRADQWSRLSVTERRAVQKAVHPLSTVKRELDLG